MLAKKRSVTSLGILVVLSLAVGAQTDKYLWLEDVSGDRAMAWVRAENERSAKVLESDPRFAGLEATALKVLESPERLPMPWLNGSDIYNTWQDATHVRGILRRTSIADYLTAQPDWHTVLDYDALGKQDNRRWVHKGLTCLYPGNELCLVALSDGGEDAVIQREFNLKTGTFVEGGFVLPRSKQEVAWFDKDTLLVASDWGPGTMTKSGYPFVVKLWKRGQPLGQAREIFRGSETDAIDELATVNDSQGGQASFFLRGLDFFHREVSLLSPDGVVRVALPGKIDIEGLLNGRLIVSLNEDWKPKDQDSTFVQGSVIALDLNAVKKDPVHLKPAAVFAPTAKEFAQQVVLTKDHLLLTTLENVQGRAYIYTRDGKGVWDRKKLDVPDNLTVSIVSGNWSDNQFFLALTGFLTPSSLLLGDAAAGVTLQQAKALAPQFDASREVVEQLEAKSTDGTNVPYFVVRRKDLKYDGNNPALLTAYGGFQISTTPQYMPDMGKLWLERGGVFINANIRGGGELVPPGMKQD